ncbi:aldo/keto reductase [Deinococcus frigens]|uniref:aldo/keto reductase n=1 Tax=Deinococcus frigens TaxID=249403 RepID=UPI000A80A4AE|nr:aldo/keto reductase [Deinococcus frigens]
MAAELERPLAQVALAWASQQPGITSPIIGVSKVAQLEDNLTSLEIVFTPHQLELLDKASALTPSMPSSILAPGIKKMIFGGATVKSWDD